MSQLLLCALQRLGKPSTATAIHGLAHDLAAENWPRWAWPASPKQTAALLKAMEKSGAVGRNGVEKDNGRDVPLWCPNCPFDINAEIPEPPTTKQKSALADLSPAQVHTLVDVLGDLVHEAGRQRRELGSLMVRQLEEFERTTDRAKRQLLAAGIEGKL